MLFRIYALFIYVVADKFVRFDFKGDRVLFIVNPKVLTYIGHLHVFSQSQSQGQHGLEVSDRWNEEKGQFKSLYKNISPLAKISMITLSSN
jgi:hypothetical protein